jgi:hypothetical protein
MDLLDIRKAVEDEFKRASRKHKPMMSAHEGYAVILEEVDELWTEVKKNPATHLDRQARMREEVIQIAAMCFRFLSDLYSEYPAEEKKEPGEVERNSFDPFWARIKERQCLPLP